MFLMMAPLFSRYGLHAAAKDNGSWLSCGTYARRNIRLCFPSAFTSSTASRVDVYYVCGSDSFISRSPDFADLHLDSYPALGRNCFPLPTHDASKRNFVSRSGVGPTRRECSGRRAKRGLLHGERGEMCQPSCHPVVFACYTVIQSCFVHTVTLLADATRVRRCSDSTLFSWSTRCLSTEMGTRKSQSPPGTSILLSRVKFVL